MKHLGRFLKDRSVARAVEYSLIAVAIGIAVTVVVLNFGNSLNTLPSHM